MKFHPLTKVEAEEKIKRCIDPECPIGDHDIHQIFYEYEMKRLTGNQVYYTYDPNCSILDPKENLQTKEVTYDKYGNKTHHMVRKDD